MSADWNSISIDEIKSDGKGAIAIGPFGSRMKSDCYVNDGIPVIRGTNITGGPTFEGEFVFITKEKADELGSSNVYKDDLVFPHRGSIGEVGIVLNDERYVISSSLMKLTCDKKKANPRYIYYFFKSRSGRHELLKNASQVGTPGIGQPLSSLKGISLNLPPLNIQNKISDILSSLDKKIHLNTQANKTLEAIAQAIFKSWFVDFDPVKAKIAALNSLSLGERAGVRAQELAELAAMCVISGKNEAQLAQLKIQDADAYQQLLQTAALFPAAMQESELGEIPVGWRIGSIGEIAKAKGGFAFKSNDFTTEGNEVVKIKNITGDGRVDLDDCDYINNEVANKNYRFKLTDGDLLMAMTGATVGKVGIVATSGKSAYVNQRVAKFESVEFGKKISWFLYPCIQRQIVFDSIVGAAQGSAQPNISSNGIESTEIVLPTSALINHYCDKLDPYFKKWISHNMESRLLAQLRDAVLPKLLSGEVVLDAEQA